MDINYFAAIEAILFACGEPVEIERLAEGLSIDKAAVREQLNAYGASLEAEDRGIRLLFLEDMVQLCAAEKYEAQIVQVANIRKNAPLSNAAMETLAVIAYNQPVTKSFIEQVRGVESSSVVNNLVEKGLVEEAGRLMVPGRPLTYRTTPNFLRCFGLSGLGDLPPVPGQVSEQAALLEEQAMLPDDPPDEPVE
ncbi:MAG: SMC-Scp complex subunit ScpB [Oscillospiraceae bacterium]|nr:SMC-Scp complex subunit ScpB [Oscillospiraceae bacterium]